MDNKAHAILSDVIASHGEQLITSTAFCKVYLTGYLADFLDERNLLIALKLRELPAAFAAFKNAELSEEDLFDAIQQVVSTSNGSTKDLAWGVDAWAAAVGINEGMRLKIRHQCFPGESRTINNGLPITIVEPADIAEDNLLTDAMVAAPRKTSRFGFGAKLITRVSAVFGLMMIQVFGSNSSPDYAVVSLPVQAPSLAKQVPENNPPVVVKPTSEKIIPAAIVQQKPEKTLPVMIAKQASEKQPVIVTGTIIKLHPPTLSMSGLLNPLPKPVDPAAHKVVQIDKPTVDTKVKKSKSVNLTQNRQKTEQLLADTEAFLKYGN